MGIVDEYMAETPHNQVDRGLMAREKKVPHYYGDTVRILLISAGVLLLLSILFDKGLLAFNLVVGIVMVLVLTIFAGLTSPRNYGAIVIDTIAAGCLFVIYEVLAVASFSQHDNVFDVGFALRQGIAFVALMALYFGIKTIRGMRSTAAEDIEKLERE